MFFFMFVSGFSGCFSCSSLNTSYVLIMDEVYLHTSNLNEGSTTLKPVICVILYAVKVTSNN